MDLISVIVPVYKVEPYLDRCVQSIVDQTYTNLEIILVDDGSPDRCPQMCDAWAKKDSRIRVIHKENGGSAQARNVGLEIAAGDYIAFADSDDVMNGSMLATLHDVAVQYDADIVECGYSMDEEAALSKQNGHAAPEVYDVRAALQKHICDALFRQVIWNKLYRASVVDQIRFVEGKRIDDEFWTYRAIGNAKKLVHIGSALYFYRQQDESVMHQKYSLKRLQGVEAHVERHEYIRVHFPEIAELSLVHLWFDCRYHGQMALLSLNDQDREKAFGYFLSIIRRFPLPYRVIFHQKTKEVVWLMIQKVSLILACRIRNALRIGL